MPVRHPRPAAAFFGGAFVPVLTADEMRAWDRRAIDESGVPEPVLMEAAGRAAAAVVQSLYPEGHVVVFAGSGNNGGDGAEVTGSLAGAFNQKLLVAVGSRPPDAALLHGWSVSTTSFDEFRESPAPASVYVDALLGTGSTGAPRAPYDAAVAWMNGEGKPVVALDGPSGIDFTTGAAAGPAVRADVTVTFGAPKRGLLLHPGRWHAGRIVAVEIGFPPLGQALGAQLITPAWAGRLPPVPPNAHKGQQGRVVIVAGRPGMAGASVLAGSGALRAGAGMCVLVAPDANRAILQASLPEALYEDRSRVEDEVLAAADAVVAGPGMGTDERSLVLLRRVIAAADAPLVFDADATTLLAQFPSLREEIRWPLLLTPHPGEMGRLLGCETADVVRDPFGAATEAAERYRCTVLLKGAASVVAEAGRPTLVNVAGHSGIATGGMGDVLSGIIGALLAVRQDARTAAGLGLYFAGRAAELAGRGRGLLPRDVAETLPDALMEIAPRESDLHLPGIVLDLPAPY